VKFNVLLVPVAAVATLSIHSAVLAAPKHQDTVQDASKVFQEMMAKAETRVPNALLRRSQAIAIIPDVKQAGLIFGGRRGTGVLMTHYTDGTWSNPVFVNVTGGSFGLQAGAKSTDMILVFPSQKSLSSVLTGRSLELGGNVTGTGIKSEGKAAEVLDDRSGGDKIIAYSRSEGVFGGIAFEGAKLAVDSGKNKDFYGRAYTTIQILNSRDVQAPVVVSSLKSVLNQAEQNAMR
jgi:SH3 domain-containing YSC84-like protein 1